MGRCTPCCLHSDGAPTAAAGIAAPVGGVSLRPASPPRRPAAVEAVDPVPPRGTNHPSGFGIPVTLSRCYGASRGPSFVIACTIMKRFPARAVVTETVLPVRKDENFQPVDNAAVCFVPWRRLHFPQRLLRSWLPKTRSGIRVSALPVTAPHGIPAWTPVGCIRSCAATVPPSLKKLPSPPDLGRRDRQRWARWRASAAESVTVTAWPDALAAFVLFAYFGRQLSHQRRGRHRVSRPADRHFCPH